MSTWRDKFRPVIARVLAEHPDSGDVELRAALRQAWETQNLGPTASAGWTYKVWLDEIRRQRAKADGKDPRRTGRGRVRKIPSRKLRRRLTAAEAREWFAKRQMKLSFNEGESSSS